MERTWWKNCPCSAGAGCSRQPGIRPGCGRAAFRLLCGEAPDARPSGKTGPAFRRRSEGRHGDALRHAPRERKSYVVLQVNAMGRALLRRTVAAEALKKSSPHGAKRGKALRLTGKRVVKHTLSRPGALVRFAPGGKENSARKKTQKALPGAPHLRKSRMPPVRFRRRLLSGGRAFRTKKDCPFRRALSPVPLQPENTVILLRPFFLEA